MVEDALVGTVRQETGSVAARRLRRNGTIPAILYGKETEPIKLALPADSVRTVVRLGHHMVDVDLSGDRSKVLVRDVQYDTFGREILHLDLVRVSLTDQVRVVVPVELRGTARGVDLGGVMEQSIHEMEVECLATALPDLISVRVTDLAIGDAIHVRDLVLPEGVAVLAEDDQVVVQVSAPSKVEEEGEAEEVEAGPAEPEVITARKAEDEESDGE